MKFDMVVGIAGQPNVGKSTLLNRIVGISSHVGNWYGKTVELITGIRNHKGYSILFVDLPGTYDLLGASEEEEIAIKYILGYIGEKEHRHRRSLCEKCLIRKFCPFYKICPIRKLFEKEEFKIYSPDILIVVLDATQIEKSLRFAISIREIFDKVIFALNKSDEADINEKILQKYLKAPVVKISAIKGVGIEKLLDTVINVWKSYKTEKFKIDYGLLEKYIEKISKKFKVNRGVIIKLLEGSPVIMEVLGKESMECYETVKREIGKDPKILIEEKRKEYINEIIRKLNIETRIPSLKRIDKIFLNKIFGPFLSFMLLLAIIIIVFTINTGFPLNFIFDQLNLKEVSSIFDEYNLTSLLSKAFESIIEFLKSISPKDVLSLFLIDGLLSGFFFVLSFLPLIFSMMFFITILEDSGLMPRISISFHRILKRFNLSGKTVFPMMFSLGCNVPGIVSTRILNKKEKIAVVLASPFIICQARLVVLAAISSAVFGNSPLFIASILSIYLISIFLYFTISSLIIRFLKEKPILIIELPKIKRPSITVAIWNSWILTRHFLEKAGTIIILLSSIVWFLLNFGPKGYETRPSFAEIIGNLIPIAKIWEVKDSWKLSFALIQGLIAKEGFLVTIAQFSGGDFVNAWNSMGLSPIESFSVLIFIMFYLPCIATLITIKKELGSWKYPIISLFLTIFVAISLSLLVLLIGELLSI